MEVQSVINESALKEARKYLIKPGIRKISAIASAAFVLLAAYCMLTGRPSTMLLAVFAIVSNIVDGLPVNIQYAARKTVYDVAGSICNCHFLWGIKND